MNDKQQNQPNVQEHAVNLDDTTSCIVDEQSCCITCSDEALPARVLRVDEGAGLALVSLKDTTEEIDITLVEDICPGDLLLVHGGVALALMDNENEAK